MCDPGIPHFEQLAPRNPQTSQSTDLYSFLHPETFQFQLVILRDKTPDDRQHKHISGIQLCPLQITTSSLPIFALENIQVLAALRGCCITKSRINGQESCCKISSNMIQIAVQCELDCLPEIKASRRGSLIQVPRIIGLVHTTGLRG